VKHRHRLRPEDRAYLKTVERLFLTDPVDPTTGPRFTDAFDWRAWRDEQERTPKRPAGQPAFGLTQRKHVVELPRRPSADHGDPVHKVTGPGWPDWFPVLKTDLVVRDRRRRKTTGQNETDQSTHTSKTRSKRKHRGC
jgi:hypothetical protein